MNDTDVFIIEHFGVKGMHWGVRKSRETSGYSFQAAHPTMDPALHSSTQSAAKEVSALMGQRYGLQLTQIKNLKTERPDEYAYGSVAFVQNTPGKREGIVYVRPDDFRKDLKQAEKSGWMAPGTTNPRGLLTHESAHALFHAEQANKRGFWVANKVVGGEMQARNKALKAADKQARKDGIHPLHQLSKISGYALASGTREEAEAEMFSQYHWGTNTPNFIKAWGETLHKEMGIDPTPFKEVVKHG